MKGLIYTTLVGIAFVVLLGMYAQAKCQPRQVVIKREKAVMSIYELQEHLNQLSTQNKRYYCGKVDGKFGAQTRQALDNYICDENAGRYFK